MLNNTSDFSDFDKEFENDFPVVTDMDYEVVSIDSLIVDLVEMPKIPEGQCHFKVKDFSRENNCATPYGIKDKIAVKFLISFEANGVLKEEPLTRKFNLSRGSESYFMKFLKELTGGNPGKSVDLKKLIGIHGTADIVHIPLDGGDVIADIKNLKPQLQQ